MTNGSWPAGWPSPFRVQGLSSVKRWWFPLPCELGMAHGAQYACGSTATSAIPSTHKSVSLGPEEGKGQFTGWLWVSNWTLELEAICSRQPHAVTGETQACVREPFRRAPWGARCLPRLHEESSPKWGTCGRWRWASAAPLCIWNPDGPSCVPETDFRQVASWMLWFQGSHEGLDFQRLLSS